MKQRIVEGIMLRTYRYINKIAFLLLFILLNLNALFAKQTESTYVTFLNYDFNKEDILEKDYNTIYVAASSPTSEHLGSLGAHAMIVLANDDNIDDSLAINYYAYHESMGELEKVIKGATVGLTGYIDIRDFHLIAERYTIGQNRTLFMYKTNISKEKIPELLDIVYAYKEKTLIYQFFTSNCSSFIGEVFSQLLSDNENEYYFPTTIMPARLLSFVEKYGFVEDIYLISPSFIKLMHGDNTLTKEEILDRHKYFKVFTRETSEDVGFDKFKVTFDDFESNTMFSEKVSKLSIGSINDKLALSFSLFDNDVTEQRQSAISLYSAKVLDAELSIVNNKLKLNNLIIFEKASYNKVNLFKNTTSSYFALKYNNNNNNFDLVGGLGYSFGGEKSLFSILPILDLNFEDYGLTLKIKSLLKLNYDNAYLLVDFDYPIYREHSSSTKTLNFNLGYRFNEDWLVEASYDILNEEYKVYLSYFVYPLIR